jgi:hypothetical protein
LLVLATAKPVAIIKGLQSRSLANRQHAVVSRVDEVGRVFGHVGHDGGCRSRPDQAAILALAPSGLQMGRQRAPIVALPKGCEPTRAHRFELLGGVIMQRSDSTASGALVWREPVGVRQLQGLIRSSRPLGQVAYGFKEGDLPVCRGGKGEATAENARDEYSAPTLRNAKVSGIERLYDGAVATGAAFHAVELSNKSIEDEPVSEANESRDVLDNERKRA